MTALAACWETDVVMKKKYFPQMDSATELIVINGESIMIDTSQRWFWTDKWQSGEKKADDDIKKGRIHRFNNVKDALQFLESPNVKS